MMNLLGCTKENFFKLIRLMDYKKSKDSDTYYFSPDNKRKRKKMHQIKVLLTLLVNYLR